MKSSVPEYLLRECLRSNELEKLVSSVRQMGSFIDRTVEAQGQFGIGVCISL